MRKARAIISEKSKDRTNGLFTHVARHGRVRHVVCTYLTYQWDGMVGELMLYSIRQAFRWPTSHNEDKWYRPEFHWTVAPVHSSNIKACLRPFSWQRLAKFWCGCSLRDRFRADVHAECRNSGSSLFVALRYLIGYRLWALPHGTMVGRVNQAPDGRVHRWRHHICDGVGVGDSNTKRRR